MSPAGLLHLTPMRHGFSLVELSIVLVILGLLTGGILAGQSLIRAAELRGVLTEYQRYSTAAYSFRDKYMGIPGDFRNATRFWGRQNGNADCVTNSAAAVAASGVCDGNGDGFIAYSAPPAGTSTERHQTWRHLANAGLVEGNYTGTAPAAVPPYFEIGSNVPASRIANGGWDMLTMNSSGHGYFTDQPSNHSLIIGAAWGGTSPYGAAFRPQEVWNIDAKIDDGKPQQGKVWAVWWDSCTTAASAADLTGNYDLAINTITCAIQFRNIF